MSIESTHSLGHPSVQERRRRSKVIPIRQPRNGYAAFSMDGKYLTTESLSDKGIEIWHTQLAVPWDSSSEQSILAKRLMDHSWCWKSIEHLVSMEEPSLPMQEPYGVGSTQDILTCYQNAVTDDAE